MESYHTGPKTPIAYLHDADRIMSKLHRYDATMMTKTQLQHYVDFHRFKTFEHLSFVIHECFYMGELMYEFYPLERLEKEVDELIRHRIKFKFRLEQEFKQLETEVLKENKFSSETDGWMFITVGYDDKVINPLLMKKCVKQIFDIKGMKWTEFNYVHEKYRRDEKGNIYEHCHTHILARTPYPSKSKLLQYMFPKTCKSKFSAYVSSRNFIDIKTARDGGTYSQKLLYIQGQKTDTKKECVELDKTWREKENLISIKFD